MIKRVGLLVLLGAWLVFYGVGILTLPLVQSQSTQGLVGYWNLDTGSGSAAIDSSGNGNNGVINGNAAWLSSASCHAGNCLGFDGTDDNAVVPHTSAIDFGTSSFTYSSWVYASTLSANQYLIEKKGWNASLGRISGWYCYANASTSGVGCVLIHTSNTYIASASNAISANAWTHVALVVDRTGSAQMYVNGVASGAAVSVSGIGSIANAVPLVLGDGAGWGSARLNGRMEEVRLYNRALSSTEISEIFSAGSAPPPTFDFALSNAGNSSVVQGGSATNVITATLSSGSTQSASFLVSGLPSGVTGSFTSGSCTPTCTTTLTLSASGTATTGNATVTVSATAGSVSKTTSFILAVNASAPIPDTQAPSIPANLSATANSSSQITMNWNASTDNVAVTNYFVDVSTTNSFSSFVSGWNSHSVGNVTTASVTGLNASTPYYFRVRAGDAANNASGNSSTASATTQSSPNPPSGNASTRIGINTTWLNSYTPMFMFTNVFKQSRAWISQNADGSGAWSNAYAIPVDADDWPLSVPFDPDGNSGAAPPQKLRTLMLDSFNGTYPSGAYTLVLGGSGQVRLTGDTGTLTFSAPGTYSVSIANPSNAGVQLELLQSSASNPVRQIDFVFPGFASTYLAQPFHPQFLDIMGDFHAIRFMNLLNTNDNLSSIPLSWTTRRKPTNRVQSSGGAMPGLSYETIIQLSNTLHTDAWINIPHMADDTYVRELARLFRDNLDPSLKVYVEHSNEVWNIIFPQTTYAIAQGCAANLHITAWPSGGYGACNDGINDGGDRAAAANAWHVQRSTRIFQIFDEEFGGSEGRVINVLGAFAASAWGNQRMLEAQSNAALNPYPARAEALAITSYYGFTAVDQNVNATPDQFIDQLTLILHNQTIPFITQNKQVANQHGIPLLAYEANHHLISATQNNAALTARLFEVYRHSRMRALTEEMIDAWFANGGDLLMFFVAIAPHSGFGGWGALEYQSQSPSAAPMYLGVQDALATYGFNPGGGTTPTTPLSCAQQNGFSCTAGETCAGITLTHSGSGVCCSSACQANTANPPATPPNSPPGSGNTGSGGRGGGAGSGSGGTGSGAGNGAVPGANGNGNGNVPTPGATPGGDDNSTPTDFIGDPQDQLSILGFTSDVSIGIIAVVSMLVVGGIVLMLFWRGI